MKDIIKFSKLFFTVSCVVFVFSCQEQSNDIVKRRDEQQKDFPERKDNWFGNNDKIDPYGDMGRKDYQKAAGTKEGDDGQLVTPKMKLPEMSNLLAPVAQEKLISDKLVSISVNETVPLKDVLVELARKAEVDVDIDKNIDGGVIFIAKNRPFSEVIDKICATAGLRYTIADGVLKIEKDTPVMRSYKFNIIDMKRSSSSNISTSSSVGGASGSTSGGSGGSSGSSSSTSSSGSSSNNSTGSGSSSSDSSSKLVSQSGDGDIWGNIQSVVASIVSKYKNETSSKGGATAAATSKTGADVGGATGIVAINKNAGVITVLANERQQAAIKEYLDRVHIELTSQVLIEAKVVEVTLNDAFQSGINWNLLMKNSAGKLEGAVGGTFIPGKTSFGTPPVATITSTTAELATAVPSSSEFNIAALPFNIFGSNSLESSVQLLQTFGTSRSLSNPRISTMNNQFAVLNFSSNQVYFDIQQNTNTLASSAGGATSQSIQTNIKTVPIGIILALQPSIDLENNEILMSIKPTLTRVTGTADNPGAKIIAFQASVPGIDTSVPIVETRELDTMLRVKSGEIMVIGGLLDQRADNTDSGLPGLSNIPYLGNLFKSVDKNMSNIETVIFLKATIVPGKGVEVEDRDFYKKFTTGSRAFFDKK